MWAPTQQRSRCGYTGVRVGEATHPGAPEVPAEQTTTPPLAAPPQPPPCPAPGATDALHGHRLHWKKYLRPSLQDLRDHGQELRWNLRVVICNILAHGASGFVAAGYVESTSTCLRIEIINGSAAFSDRVLHTSLVVLVGALVANTCNDKAPLFLDLARPGTGAFPMEPRLLGNAPLRVVDLYAGIGGWTEAAVNLGFDLQAALDRNPHAVAVYNASLLSGHRATLMDTRHTEAILLLLRTNADILCASFPCQPYSAKGDRRGKHDPRDMLPNLLYLTGLTRPAALGAECVAGFHCHDEGRSSAELLSDLRGIGYGARTVVHQLGDLLPAKRKRWLLEAIDISLGKPHLTPPAFRLAPRQDFARQVNLAFGNDPEGQLALSTMERHTYLDPYYTPHTYARILKKTTTHLETTLHSYSVALGPCPCGCRTDGLSPARIKGNLLGQLRERKDEHGAVVYSFVHPAELAHLHGFGAARKWQGQALRLQNCLLGNSISPVHAAVVLIHIRTSLRMACSLPCDHPDTQLWNYMRTFTLHMRGHTVKDTPERTCPYEKDQGQEGEGTQATELILPMGPNSGRATSNGFGPEMTCPEIPPDTECNWGQRLPKRPRQDNPTTSTAADAAETDVQR